LRQLLVEELKNPKPSGEPIIFLEGDGVRSGYHLFVVWNEWANLGLPSNPDKKRVLAAPLGRLS